MAYFAYGYFVKTPNGSFHSGHDFGPTLQSYKVRDSLAIHNGVEGIIVGILKGEAAKRSGDVDVGIGSNTKPSNPTTKMVQGCLGSVSL